ncbi:MAG: DUF4116 domain-containing protein [Chlamydiales bacterium]|nr:DUF4116 domain-containing protein [Chlamydiia bacterium]MCP5507095.1 DUF4116 domain-containing protein [Chlamydiales bacterium]
MRIENFFIAADQAADYIPVVSTVSNLVDLFQKTVVISNMKPTTIEKAHYFSHLNKKSKTRCAVLLIPVLGNLAVAIYDFATRRNNKEYMLKEIERDVSNAKNLGDKLRNDQEFMKELIQKHPITSKYLGNELRNNKAFMKNLRKEQLPVRKRQTDNPNSFKTRKEMEKYEKENPVAWEYLGEELSNNREFIESQIEEDPKIVDFAGEKLTDNDTFMQTARTKTLRYLTTTNAPQNIKNISEKLSKDEEFLKLLLDEGDKQNGNPEDNKKPNLYYGCACRLLHNFREKKSSFAKERWEEILNEHPNVAEDARNFKPAARENKSPLLIKSDLYLKLVTINPFTIEWVEKTAPQKGSQRTQFFNAVLYAVQKDGLALNSISSKISSWNNKQIQEEIYLAAIKQNAKSLEFVPEKFKKDIEFMKKAVDANASIMSLELVDNIRKELEKDPLAKAFAANKKGENIEDILNEITKDPQGVAKLPDSYKKNRDFLLRAVAKNPEAYQYIEGCTFKQENSFMLDCVEENPKVMQYFTKSEQILDSWKVLPQKDPRFVKEAVQRNPEAIKYADKSLRNDSDFVWSLIPHLKENQIEKLGPHLSDVDKSKWPQSLVNLMGPNSKSKN